MTDLHRAIAFVQACSRLRVTNAERERLLKEAGGTGYMLEYLDAGGDRQRALAENLKEEQARQRHRRYPDSWRAIDLFSPDYPQRLKHIGMPPAFLFASGANLEAMNSPSVIAVIGSRKPSVYGVEVTKKLTTAIASRGVPVVSGGARGIDALAHRTVLARGGSTVAVLGNGLGVTYPPEHRALFSRIEKSGALLTEFTPDTAPRRPHFPARNRIIAGLSDAVLVTEASGSSGTLITAGFAADYGRDVLAVPGSILSGTSRSCHNLIKDGAVLVEAIDDIPHLPPPSAPLTPGSRAGGDRNPLQYPVGDPEDRMLLQALENAPRTLLSLAEASGMDRGKVAFRLAAFTKRGWVRCERGLYTLAKFPRICRF